MKITVERTFNLGNYENIRFTYELEVQTPTFLMDNNGVPVLEKKSAELIQIVETWLTERCHIAYEAYNRSLKEMKARIEIEAQRIVNQITGGKKP